MVEEDVYFYLRKEKNGCFSNFERAIQKIGDEEYSCNEVFYQSVKTNKKELSEWLKNAPIPYYAMVVGHNLRKEDMKENWDAMKNDVMLEGLRAKFSQNPDLKAKLIATYPARLHENSPTDLYWGVKGKDMLGKLLMKVRDELMGVK